MAGISIRHNLGWDKTEGVFIVANYWYNATTMTWEKVSRASGLADGRKVVAVTNTAIVLGSGACLTVWITALIGNTAEVVIGGSGVIYPSATRTGKLLYPGDTMTIEIDNLSRLYVNGTAGHGVSFAYTT